MKPLTILEDLNILKDVVSSSGIYIGLIAVGCFIVMFISRTNRINANIKRKLYISVYGVTILALLIIFYKDLSTMFDYMMNNLFVVFCFPNLAAYLVAIIITNIILWTTTLNGKEDLATKIINSSVFVGLHYLLILFMITVKDNKLDVFSQESIYSNEQAVALITLSSVIFIVWIIFNIVYKMVRMVIYKKKGMELNQVVVYTNQVETSKKERKVRMTEAPAFIRRGYTPKPAITPTIMSANPVVIPLDPPVVKPQSVVINQEPIIIKPDPIVEKSKPQKSKEMLVYEEALTLEDYKLLLNLLKAEKEKMKEQHRDVVIKNEEKENRNIQNRLGELQDLYRSVR